MAHFASPSADPRGARQSRGQPRRSSRPGQVRGEISRQAPPTTIQRLLYDLRVSPVVLSHAESVSRLGYALSDPTRLQILLALREAPAVPSDLADALGVSRQVVSNQLACLRGCGLVEAVREGRHAWYRLADPHLGLALDELLRVVLVVDPECCSGEECSCSR